MMLSMLYILLWAALAYIVATKVPKVKPRTSGFQNALGTSIIYGAFALLGFALPMFLNDRAGLDFGPDWLMRTSQIVGAALAFYVGRRGAFVWGLVFGLGFVALMLSVTIGLLWRFIAPTGA